MGNLQDQMTTGAFPNFASVMLMNEESLLNILDASYISMTNASE
ncbi:MAG: hypothetical protein ABI666_06790 [Ferruginibacter sp.]